MKIVKNKPGHEISNNMVCVTSDGSDQAVHTLSLIAEPLLVACIFYECLATDRTSFGVPKLKNRLHRLPKSILQYF